MSGTGAADPPPAPSLAVVEQALAREEDSYRDRADSIDTKLGLLLGAAGVFVALIGLHPGVAGLVSQVLAIAAGGAAVRGLIPRVDKAISPAALRDRYLAQDPTTTRLVLLNTRIRLHQGNERQLFAKARGLRMAALLLLAAGAAIVVGAIVELA